MPTLAVDNFNIVTACLGGFITLFGLVSYLLKEKFYLSEALIATVVGIIFSHALGWIRPLEYANNNPEDLETVILYFSRLVLGVQLVLAGVQLPSKYLKTEWKSLAILLGPGMCIMWIVTSLLTWALVPNINILFALAIGACVTPTDPILSNGIVKGKFADKNIPSKLQKIIIAESGTNDGLGYPFLFLALDLVRHVNNGGLGSPGGGGRAIALWFYETWAYTILLSVAYGFVVGWLAKELLHWAEERRYVDRESFLVFAITLALFIVGTCGMLGTDDILACFIAGNAFTWDDWFRQETEDDSLQPTIDFLLNVSIFAFYGSVIPWYEFVHNDVVPIYRLIPLAILVLLFRRLPMVLAFHKFIHQIEELKHAIFVGFFGPIGVSAVFYIYIAREFLAEITYEGQQREDARRLGDLILIVVWFLVTCSIVVHGLSIPLGKLGFYIPRTISQAVSTERSSRPTSQSRDPDEPESFHIRRHVMNETRFLERSFRHRRPTTSEIGPQENKRSFFPAVIINVAKRFAKDTARPHGATVHGKEGVRGRSGSSSSGTASGNAEDDSGDNRKASISAPMNPRILGKPVLAREHTPVPEGMELGSNPGTPADRRHSDEQQREDGPSSQSFPWQRSIRFGDKRAPSDVEQGTEGSEKDASAAAVKE